MAKKLAKKQNIDENLAYIAGLCHDYYKYESIDTFKSVIKDKHLLDECEKLEVLYHAYASACCLEHEFGITDKQIYDAVKYHVFGRIGMSKLTEIIMLSDFIEENRIYEACIECRNLVDTNYDLAVYKSYYYTNQHLKNNGLLLHDEQIKLEEIYKEKVNMKLLEVIVGSLEKVKATSIHVYDVRETSPMADYLIVASVSTDRQAEGVVTYIKENAYKFGYNVRQIEGKNGGWTLIDCHDCIVHVFSEDERCHYKLDSLYIDCPQVNIEELNTNI